MLKVVRPLRNGQITIPVEMRRKLGMDQETLLQLRLIDEEIRLSPVKVSRATTGSPWLAELYELFTDSRKKAKKYSSKEIDRDIKKAIKAIRGPRTRTKFGSG